MQERFPCVSRNRSLGGGSQIHLLFLWVNDIFFVANCHYAKIIM